MAENNLQSGSVHARVTFKGSDMSLISGNPFPDNNVSSIEKLATGIYKINYSTTLAGADHVVAANCHIASSSITPGCVELVSTDADSATIAAKLAGEGFGSVTYFDPLTVDFIASSESNGPVNLSVNTIKAWACIKNNALVDGANIESVVQVEPGVATVNFTRGFRDYTVIAASANCPSNQATASVTYQARGSKSIRLYSYGFGESVNNRTSIAYTPTQMNLIVFGNLNDFEVTLNKSQATGSCEYQLPTGCRAISEPVTVTVKGGVGPFTYQWSQVSGAVGFQIANPTSATTVFSKTGTQDAESADFLVTVTDSQGKKARSELVAVTLTRSPNPNTPL